MPENITVTVAPGRRLIHTFKWTDPDGVEHGSTHIAGEGERVPVPAPVVSTLRAEGVIL